MDYRQHTNVISEKRKTSEFSPTIDQIFSQGNILNIGAERSIPNKAYCLLIQEAKNQSSVIETAVITGQNPREESYTEKPKNSVKFGKEQLKIYELTYSKVHSVLGDV